MLYRFTYAPFKVGRDSFNKFYQLITNPSPLAWILIVGVAFISGWFLNYELVGLGLTVVFGIALLVFLPKAVVDLKLLIVDQAPSQEYRWWQKLTDRYCNTVFQHNLCTLMTVFSYLIIAINPIIPFLKSTRSPVVIVLVGLIMMFGQVTRVLRLWSSKQS